MMASPRRRSLSTRVALTFAVSLAVLTALTTVLVISGYAMLLHARIDGLLAADVTQWRAHVVETPVGPAWDTSETVQEAEAGPMQGKAFLRLIDRQGRVVWFATAFAAWPALLPGTVTVPPPARRSRPWGSTYARSHYAAVPGGWLEVTRAESSVHHGMWLIASLLLAAFGLSTLLAALVGRGLTRRALRPLRDFREAAEEVEAAALGRRLPVGDVRDEIGDLAETFNRMLGRLEASFERERRFSADAAHELMTPLARLRAEAELALRAEQKQTGSFGSAAALAAILQETDGLIALTSALLRAARGDTRRERLPTRVDLSALCSGQIGRAEALAEAQGLDLASDVEPGVAVIADRKGLEETIENVLANALKYTPPGGRVTLRLRREGAHARLTVADTGVGFTPEEADYAFERFFRSDRAEVQARRGSGLGLAVVRETVEVTGGRVWIESVGAGHGSRVEFSVPLAPPTR